MYIHAQRKGRGEAGIECKIYISVLCVCTCLVANRHTNSVELSISSPSYTSEDHTSFSIGDSTSYPTHRLLVTSNTPDDIAERFLQDTDIGGVSFYPASSPSQQLTEAEVHIPRQSPPAEVMSTSVRVPSDEFATPKSSLQDPSPLSVAMDMHTINTDNSSLVPSPKDTSLSAFYPTRNLGVRVTSLKSQSLQLPPGPRKRIVISPGASSNTSSCDGDDSEVTSEDSEFMASQTHFLPSSEVVGRRKKKWGGSQEYLTPRPHQGFAPRSLSVSPIPRGSPGESYSEDDTVLVTRRRVNIQHHQNQNRSFFNLSPTPSMEVVEFSTPIGSGLGRSASMRLSRERTTSPYPTMNTSPMATMSRTVPLSAITHTQ